MKCRMPGRGLAVAVVIALLLLSACTSDRDADDSGPKPTQSSTPAPVDSAPATATSATTPAVSATEDAMTALLTQTEITWEGCELLALDDGSFTAACGFRTHPFFENWLVQIWYHVDDEGNKTSISGNSIRGYGTTCEWDLADGLTYEAPLVDGIATYEGEVLGSGLCDGLRWAFTQVWDDNAQTLVTSGSIVRSN